MIVIDPSTKQPVDIPPGLYWVRRALPSGAYETQPAKLCEENGVRFWMMLGDERRYGTDTNYVYLKRALPVPSDI